MSEESPKNAPAIRDRQGHWIPGFAPRSHRPKGSRGLNTLLEEAIRRSQRRRIALHEPCLCVKENPELPMCKTLDEHFTRRAFLDDSILIAVQRKRIPDLTHQTGQLPPTLVNVLYGATPRPPVVDPIPSTALTHG